MPLRIQIEELGDVAALRVDGHLGWDGVDEVRHAYARCRGRVELDLVHLQALDGVAIAYLQGLVQAGTRVRRATPYIAALLGLPATGGGHGRDAS